MVDKTEIDRAFRVYFRVLGTYEIDHEGRINVKGDVNAREDFSGPHLPVQFGKVEGDCDLEVQDRLQDLQGAPHTVTGEFFVLAKNLTHLTGAPEHVGARCVLRSNQLRSLAHLPKTAQALRINMSPTLPLLRLTERSYPIVWGFPASLGGTSNPLLKKATEIMDKYVGTGRAGALQAAVELIKAGCKENARW
jgi:hypothetical protein